MSSPTTPAVGSYQVALAGRLGPAQLAAVAGPGVQHLHSTSRFVVDLPAELGVLEIAAMLRARGLVLLDIRRLGPAGEGTGQRDA
ncbi:hypothetical protein N865_15110 [Intrasporangium oryzae NRRL B-24470]|uniref:Uncharacterized protein n=1 Tax=Intrasporangium oryzae NRRL B-24470 TaxID=1386089 RepID=W9G6P1_9MICO|nr:hypothetical protein [Intrasporangium oryzae]EWT01680.1 hypothetical protein N865_15110 [Intrasporangium oryzae NRRL B-24470]